MRALLVPLLGLLAAALGCHTAACPEEAALGSPEETLATFQRAFACDLPELEYRCFADDVKRSFGGYTGYTIGRDVLRRENPFLPWFVGVADLEARATIERSPEGERARARIDAGDAGTLVVELVNQPEYRLVLPDGTTTREFADAVVAERASGRVDVTIHDRDLAGAPPGQVQSVEIEDRWVIAGFPGLEAAVDAARREPRP